MRLALASVAIFTALWMPMGVASAQEASLEITLDQSRITTDVGRIITIESRIVNRTGRPAGRMLAHVNVASADGTYVDLEDWSVDVTKSVEALQPDESTTVTWDLQAVNAGSFHVYVVLLPDNATPIASPSARVNVGEKRNLNAGGALPVAIAVPALLGLGAAAIRYRARNRSA